MSRAYVTAMPRMDVLFLALAAFAFGTARANAPAPLWGPHIDFEAKPGSKRSLGEADFFLPLSQDARTLVFGNLRTRFDNKSSYEGNLGAGVRRMLDNGWNLGAYGYFDRRRSETGHYYNQTTLGAEALGPDWDFRANAYIPQGDRVRTLSTTVTDGGPSTAALVGTVIQVTTPGSTTSTREERSLAGYDLEAGWRLPLFDRMDRRQLRAYIGNYRFHDSVTTVSGPRLRAELELTDLPQLWRGAALLFGAEAQHDNVRGGQNFLSVRLRIPLGKTEEQPRQLTWQERRMTAPVVRDVDIVTNARTVSTTAATQVETAAATVGNQNITVLDSATTPNLQAALNTAGPNSTVILSGTFDLGNGNATLQAGQTVMGTGSMTVRTPSGRVATLTASQGATISSTLQLNTIGAVVMADNSTLTGMTIVRNPTFGSEHGVDVINVSGVTLTNNTISSTVNPVGGTPVGVFVDGSSNVRVAGNTISGTNLSGANSMGLYMRNSTVIAANNTLSGTGIFGDSFAAFLVGPLTLQSGSSGNILANGICNVANPGSVSGSLTYTAGGIPGACPL